MHTCIELSMIDKVILRDIYKFFFLKKSSLHLESFGSWEIWISLPLLLLQSVYNLRTY